MRRAFETWSPAAAQPASRSCPTLGTNVWASPARRSARVIAHLLKEMGLKPGPELLFGSIEEVRAVVDPQPALLRARLPHGRRGVPDRAPRRRRGDRLRLAETVRETVE